MKPASRSLWATLGSLLMGLALISPAFAQDRDEAPEPPGWDGIKKEFYDGREVEETNTKIVVEAPDKADDAAVVPITVHINNADLADSIKTLRIFIDNNPMPLVGAFTFGRAAGIGPKTISTRVRFDSFSYIRAVVETEGGTVHMAAHFVQAAGGCSSSALKDVAAAVAQTGQMQIKKISSGKRFASQQNQSMVTAEAQVMLRHPNFSGIQMDPITGQYIPAKYVRELDVTRGGELVFHMEAGISLSTNPNIRFTYGSVENETLDAKASDSDGATFIATSANNS
ncbi:MAG TPA: quinoprotein dehydrogenase-associated SoxYZ-like carrier [Hyphomicrobium sp.]|nr:quinoprotein dehydrogenase-associated SoxYZ-like carrier [Hyphomicrobium sp.]